MLELFWYIIQSASVLNKDTRGDCVNANCTYKNQREYIFFPNDQNILGSFVSKGDIYFTGKLIYFQATCRQQRQHTFNKVLYIDKLFT